MTLADISIKRPTFITCIVIVMIVIGIISFINLPIDQMPDVTFPTVSVTVNYSGAGPLEIETLLTKPLEDEIGTISGLSRLTSKSMEGISLITAEFKLGSDIKTAEQHVRDKVTAAKVNFPHDNDISEPIIRRMDPSSEAIIKLSLQAKMSDKELYDFADQQLKIRLEQINNIGQIKIMGGKKREIQIQLDRNKLKARNFSVTQINNQLQTAGDNIPAGKVSKGLTETIYRSLGEFSSIDEILNTIINLQNNEIPSKIYDVGKVVDTNEDETGRVFVNGERSLFINIYKQSGTNTLAVANDVKIEINKLNKELEQNPAHPVLQIVQDSSKAIIDNVNDVEETIVVGILLTIFVVFLFLANWRSTLITGLALPNSLIGAFIFMGLAGFTLNSISLLALTLAVGLLIDDAIVVRENIFRHLENGEDGVTSAQKGTKEVSLAVIATTSVIIAVFAPVGFMGGVIGQIMKQFGLTICFAMMISLFDALTIAPMLSAYLASNSSNLKNRSNSLLLKFPTLILNAFDGFQKILENFYEKILAYIITNPLKTLLLSFIIFILCTLSITRVHFNFMPPQDSGEISIDLDLPPGTNLDGMEQVALTADSIIRKHPEISLTTLTVGGTNGEAYKASIYIKLKTKKERTLSTSAIKNLLREQLIANPLVAKANPQVKQSAGAGPGGAELTFNLVGNDQKLLIEYSTKILDEMKKNRMFYDSTSSYRTGKPEFQIRIKPEASSIYGINSRTLGQEVRSQVEGNVPVKFRENGWEYNVRTRLKEDQRNLEENFNKIFVPNINNRLVRLSDVATGHSVTGAVSIDRVNRGRYIEISSELTKGVGIDKAIQEIYKIAKEKVNLPPQFNIMFTGHSEHFQEMVSSFATAIFLGVMFVFLVLASLYESFITPFAIMLALPLAIAGAFFALFLAGEPLSIFSLLGIIMLLGVACKNSILLIDTTKQMIDSGINRSDALIAAGKKRLRPILMTSIALIMGAIPVAIGLNEASAQRTSMGYAIIGGVVSSTLLTLLVVPASFSYIDNFRIWLSKVMKRIFLTN